MLPAMKDFAVSTSNKAHWETPSRRSAHEEEPGLEESEASSSSSSFSASTSASGHFDYAGTYLLTGIYHDSSMETIHLPTPGTLVFHPLSSDVYNMDICLRSRICGQIHVAPNEDDDGIMMEADVDGESEVFDNIVGISNLGFLTSKARQAPDHLELLVANILSECDMIRFVGDQLVLEGPSGAIECCIMAE